MKYKVGGEEEGFEEGGGKMEEREGTGVRCKSAIKAEADSAGNKDSNRSEQNEGEDRTQWRGRVYIMEVGRQG